ncbi:hypothetical protein HDV05_006540 [Chytridiales sp. JEL 0842]|nr:hypothetical protein HDV05_006540 [Chytridiales sp. JEL 0842]
MSAVKFHANATLAPVASLLAVPFFLAASLFLNLTRKSRPSFNPSEAVIVITGASSGIGAELAHIYARQKVAVLVLCARRKAELEKVASECRDLGAKEVVVEVMDVAEESQVKASMQRVGDRYGKIDVLVLNAGISMHSKVSEMQDGSICRRIMEVNYMGCVNGTIYALPYLKKSAIRGKIAVVSSGFGYLGGPFRSGYCASKFALKGFFDALRVEEPGLDISMIYPGVVRTEINRTRLGAAPSSLDLRKAMSAEECAGIVANAIKYGHSDVPTTLALRAVYYLRDLFPSVRDAIMRKFMERAVVKKSE